MSKVTMQHIRAAGFCSKGGRQVAARLGIDWSEFATNGLPPEAFDEHLHDHQIKRLLEVYYQCQEKR